MAESQQTAEVLRRVVETWVALEWKKGRPVAWTKGIQKTRTGLCVFFNNIIVMMSLCVVLQWWGFDKTFRQVLRVNCSTHYDLSSQQDPLGMSCHQWMASSGWLDGLITRIKPSHRDCDWNIIFLRSLVLTSPFIGVVVTCGLPLFMNFRAGHFMSPGHSWFSCRVCSNKCLHLLTPKKARVNWKR